MIKIKINGETVSLNPYNIERYITYKELDMMGNQVVYYYEPVQGFPAVLSTVSVDETTEDISEISGITMKEVFSNVLHSIRA